MILNEVIVPRSRVLILLFLHLRGQGYLREMSTFFKKSIEIDPLYKQLKQLEHSKIVTSKFVGHKLYYKLNTKFPFYPEMKSMLKKTVNSMPVKEREKIVSYDRSLDSLISKKKKK